MKVPYITKYSFYHAHESFFFFVIYFFCKNWYSEYLVYLWLLRFLFTQKVPMTFSHILPILTILSSIVSSKFKPQIQKQTVMSF